MVKRGAYRPKKRQKKDDQLLNPGATKEEIECDLATAEFDRTVRAMDQKWGIDRLIELVDANTAHKFAQALGRLNEAIYSKDPALVLRRANDCVKGMKTMDGMAEADGAEAASDSYWEFQVKGRKMAIMADAEGWPAVRAKRPDLELLTLHEIGVVFDWFQNSKLGQMTDEVKAHFPKAEITDAKAFNDEIPF